MHKKVKLGLIGNGWMMRNVYLPYLEKRITEKGDIEILWAGGCLCLEEERANCPMTSYRARCESGAVDNWRIFLREGTVDGILVSLPNSLHSDPIRKALSSGVNVAVDKPTTIGSRECHELVKLATANDLVFVTLSQRRYEDVYRTVADIIQRGGLGKPLLINYMIAHEYFDRGKNSWRTKKSMSGGGILQASGYHGIDTILWLLDLCPDPSVRAQSVSVRCILEKDTPNSIETVAVVRILLNNGGIFNAVSSYENPRTSLDENIKIFGTEGAIRIMRDRPRKLITDESAANLSYQHIRGSYSVYDNREWHGKRSAPLEDFIEAVHAKLSKKKWSVLSPASDSVQTIRIIELAYESAAQDGQEINL